MSDLSARRRVRASNVGRGEFGRRAVLLGSVVGLLGPRTAHPQQRVLPPLPAEKEKLAAYTREMVTQNSLPFTIGTGELAGPAVDFLLDHTVRSQFVLIGEYHEERDVPVFAGELFTLLKRRRGFRYLAVEQDPLATEYISADRYRGNARAIAALARRYPVLIGFSSDQDLELMALANRDGSARHPTVWGLEQVQGALNYLEELHGLAPKAKVRALVEARMADALAAQPQRINATWYLATPGAMDRVRELSDAFKAKPGSRAEYLLSSMQKSAEIYSYYTRQERGEPSGLYNNVVREDLLKANFMRPYRQAAADGSTPKVLFKMGQWHMYRGRSPGGAFTIGNFAHEFAAANGMDAFGVATIATGGNVAWAELEAFLRPLLPRAEPDEPVLVDLHILRPIASSFTGQLDKESDRRALLNFIHGYDAMVLLPHGQKASWALTGFPTR